MGSSPAGDMSPPLNTGLSLSRCRTTLKGGPHLWRFATKVPRTSGLVAPGNTSGLPQDVRLTKCALSFV